MGAATVEEGIAVEAEVVTARGTPASLQNFVVISTVSVWKAVSLLDQDRRGKKGRRWGMLGG